MTLIDLLSSPLMLEDGMMLVHILYDVYLNRNLSTHILLVVNKTIKRHRKAL